MTIRERICALQAMENIIEVLKSDVDYLAEYYADDGDTPELTAKRYVLGQLEKLAEKL